MAEYIDSSTETKSEYIRTWLDNNLVPNIKSLRIQTGYFRYSAIEPFEQVLKSAIQGGNPVQFVIGSNKGSLLAEDAKRILKIVKGKPNCSFTIVALKNGEFHPKCYQITRDDTSDTALVGSGNLTFSGIALNMEAAIILDTRNGDDIALINKIVNSIDKWKSANEDDGAYQIKSMQDIKNLQRSKIIDIGDVETGILSRKVLLGRKKLRKTLKKNLKRHWALKRRAAGIRPIVASVLIAEIPKGGPGKGRWKQANFDKDNYQHFFGMTIGGTQQHVFLQHVDANGELEPMETRPGVTVSSKNYRFELGAGAGLDYPSRAPPIGVFIRIAHDTFRYRLLMPTDPHYSTVANFLISSWSGRSDRMRRIIANTRVLRRIWPNSPLWVRPLRV